MSSLYRLAFILARNDDANIAENPKSCSSKSVTSIRECVTTTILKRYIFHVTFLSV